MRLKNAQKFKKKIYKRKNVTGIDIKAEIPKNPHCSHFPF